MNKLFTTLLMMCVGLMGSITWAESLNESQALNIASNFMSHHAIPTSNLTMAHKAQIKKAPGKSEKAAYYAFNSSRGGYVLVAGDDRVPAVLGYSDKGNFDLGKIPDAMRELLDGYAAQIDALDHGAKAAPHFANGNAIAPLVTAQWDQSEPYNLLFPTLNNGRVAYVGCVATAMAQVLYYWKWPARPTMPLPAYTSKDLSIYMPQLPVVNFEPTESTTPVMQPLRLPDSRCIAPSRWT